MPPIYRTEYRIDPHPSQDASYPIHVDLLESVDEASLAPASDYLALWDVDLPSAVREGSTRQVRMTETMLHRLPHGGRGYHAPPETDGAHAKAQWLVRNFQLIAPAEAGVVAHEVFFFKKSAHDPELYEQVDAHLHLDLEGHAPDVFSPEARQKIVQAICDGLVHLPPPTRHRLLETRLERKVFMAMAEAFVRSGRNAESFDVVSFTEIRTALHRLVAFLVGWQDCLTPEDRGQMADAVQKKFTELGAAKRLPATTHTEIENLVRLVRGDAPPD